MRRVSDIFKLLCVDQQNEAKHFCSWMQQRNNEYSFSFLSIQRDEQADIHLFKHCLSSKRSQWPFQGCTCQQQILPNSNEKAKEKKRKNII